MYHMTRTYIGGDGLIYLTIETQIKPHTAGTISKFNVKIFLTQVTSKKTVLAIHCHLWTYQFYVSNFAITSKFTLFMLICWDVHPHPWPSTVKYTLDVHAILYMYQRYKNSKNMHCEICKSKSHMIAAVKSVSETWLDDSVNEEAKDALYDPIYNCSIPILILSIVRWIMRNVSVWFQLFIETCFNRLRKWCWHVRHSTMSTIYMIYLQMLDLSTFYITLYTQRGIFLLFVLIQIQR